MPLGLLVLLVKSLLKIFSHYFRNGMTYPGSSSRAIARTTAYALSTKIQARLVRTAGPL